MGDQLIHGIDLYMGKYSIYYYVCPMETTVPDLLGYNLGLVNHLCILTLGFCYTAFSFDIKKGQCLSDSLSLSLGLSFTRTNAKL